MPLTSVVAAASIAIFEPLLGAWRAAQLPFVLLSAALVPFTAFVGWELWRSRQVAWAAGILAILAGPFLVLYPQVNNIAVFGAAGAGAVWCAIRAVRAPRAGWWLVASGALAGVATLTRVDGLLLVVAPAVAWWVRPGARSVLAGAASAAAFLLVLAPWLARDLAVFGAPFPSAGGHTLWITSYNEQFSISRDPSPASYFASGIGTVVGSKLAAWGELVGRVAVLMGGLFVLPFGWGLWAERRRRELAPFLIYFVVVFVAMGPGLHLPRAEGRLLPLGRRLAALRPAAGRRLPAGPVQRRGPMVAVPAPAGHPSVPAGGGSGGSRGPLAGWLGRDRWPVERRARAAGPGRRVPPRPGSHR